MKRSRISDEAVRNATGRDWNEWEAFLDDARAEALSHREIVSLLEERGGVESGWWRQTVANGYEKLKGKRTTGETQGAGFQIGVQRTVAMSSARAWDLLTSPEGLRTWLGPGADFGLDEGKRYRLDDGSQGEVRVVRPGSHIRITWKPESWLRASTIQARVEPKGDRCVIAFHEEHLPGSGAREERRSHFRSALDRLRELGES